VKKAYCCSGTGDDAGLADGSLGIGKRGGSPSAILKMIGARSASFDERDRAAAISEK
jgi:hypothetical protein